MRGTVLFPPGLWTSGLEKAMASVGFGEEPAFVFQRHGGHGPARPPAGAAGQQALRS